MGLGALPPNPREANGECISVDVILYQYAFVSTAQDLHIFHYQKIKTNSFIIICMCLQEYFAGNKLKHKKQVSIK